MLFPVYLAAILVSAVLAIYFKHTNQLKNFAVFKPLTTVLIIVLSLLINWQSDNSYGWIITLGLVFSLLGDVLLLKKSQFIYGLGAFLIAHIIFIYAFSSTLGFQPNLFVLVPLLIIGLIYYLFLYPSLKSYVIPVALYIIAIIVMDWQAIALVAIQNTNEFNVIGLGSILFSFSDAVLGYNKFKKEFKLAEILILSTYWLAIFLFCVSAIK